jgi:hypothetical protein
MFVMLCKIAIFVNSQSGGISAETSHYLSLDIHSTYWIESVREHIDNGGGGGASIVIILAYYTLILVLEISVKGVKRNRMSWHVWMSLIYQCYVKISYQYEFQCQLLVQNCK